MSLDKTLTKKSKLLALVLRHKPQAIDLELDPNGWASVDFITKSGKGITHEDIETIVTDCAKGRYELSEDKTKIRAIYGHSVDVRTVTEPSEPPEILYHGTATKTVSILLKQGLKSMKRKYVHLSTGTEMATSVGSRHGTPAVLKVRAKALFDTGHLFYNKGEHVWLTDFVPPEFIEVEW
jgi:putative RNA 2'-phosphotransferase